MFKLTINACSDKGCVRNNNEDMVLVSNVFVRSDSYRVETDVDDNGRYIVAVADGMGGHRSGDVASEETLKSLSTTFISIPNNLEIGAFNESFYEWLDSINKFIERLGLRNERYRGMGTTLAAIVIYEDKIFWLNCGDSRIYRYRNGVLRQISHDHSLSNLTGNQDNPNVIVNCIGGGCKTSYIDLVEFTKDLMPNDMYLLCSDGLDKMLTAWKLNVF